MKRRLGRRFFVHVLREVLLAVTGVSVILLLLLVTNQVAFALRKAAEGDVPSSVVFELVRLSVGENSVIVLPIALLLGILIALGRLYHDSEMAAAQACGLGNRQIYGPTLLVTAVAAGLSGWIAFSAGPEAARRSYEIRLEALRTAMTRGLSAGQFRSLGGGAVLHFRERGADGELREVFFQRPVRTREGDESIRPGTLEIIVARRASYSLSADGNLYTVTLRDGRRHEGVPGQGAWRNLGFAELVLPIPVPDQAQNYRRPADMLRTGELLAEPSNRNLGELHWRIASVIIPVVLGLLAVPLARLRPRQGRYARVGWGVLLFALYTNVLIAGRTMLERGRIPAWLGLWWVHVLVVVVALALMFAPTWIHRARVRWRRPVGMSSQPT